MFSRIVSSVSSALDLNLATLSGCIDIIAVYQEDGTVKSTPFHVRFGKTKLLRSREKEVFICVNGNPTDLRMKLSSAGEAYFEDLEHLQNDYEVQRQHEADKNELMKEPLEMPDTLELSNSSSSSPNSKGNINGSLGPLQSGDVVTLNRSNTSTIDREVDDQLLTPLENEGSKTAVESSGITDETSYLEFSNCGHLLLGTQADATADSDVFVANLMTWEDLNSNPTQWYHPSLVCRFDFQPPFYPGKVALPLIASWMAFNRPLSLNAVKCLMHASVSAVPAKDTSLMKWMFGAEDKQKKKSSTSTLNVIDSKAEAEVNQLDSAIDTSPFPFFTDCAFCDAGSIKRTLRPTAKQLMSLNLKPGSNTVTFTVTSSLQGIKTITGTIYLWPKNSKIIVSDVDGTITRSDVWGQLMPIVGRDWSHEGVAELFTKCRQNNYKLLYLTARAIGQADATRDYLFGLRQGESNQLPDGPLIMSPDRLFPSFKREVIDRKPYVFKIAALRDIRNLFPKNYNPFYAGFGNRETDHRAYVHIGVPESRVFIIDTSGIIHHINKTFAKTYASLGEISSEMFPPIPGGDGIIEDAYDTALEEQVRLKKRIDKNIIYRRIKKDAGQSLVVIDSADEVLIAQNGISWFNCCQPNSIASTTTTILESNGEMMHADVIAAAAGQ